LKEVIIRNPEVLNILNEYLWFYRNRTDLENIQPQCSDDQGGIDKWCGDEYAQEIVGMGERHDGFPNSSVSYNLREYELYATSGDRSLPEEWYKKHHELDKKISIALGVRNTAVATLYPPDGYISWHNNANAHGFNIIFSWSETGESQFDYLEDDGDGKKVELIDRKGEWVCRYGVFGSYYNGKHPIVYHCAKTKCWRITIAFVFNHEESTQDFQEMVIEDITTP